MSEPSIRRSLASLKQYSVVSPDEDNDHPLTQVKLAIGDAISIKDGTGDMDCLVAHLVRLHDLLQTKPMFNELVRRVERHDGLDNHDLPMATLLAGMERMASSMAYWSKVETSYTPEVAAYLGICNVLDAYREATQ